MTSVDQAFESDPPPGRIGAGLTGGVQVGPLALAAEDLRVLVPLATPADLASLGP